VNATLRDNINVADETLISAGAIIMKDTLPQEVHVPASSKVHSIKSVDVKIS
jgi:hypothetical protein